MKPPVNAGEAFGYSVDRTNETAKEVWLRAKDIMSFYRTQACPCAFPRFRQLVAFDGIQQGGSCYCSETEAFIHFAKDHFIREPIDPNGENTMERWSCPVCASAHVYGWSDFSIHVQRAFLKEEKLSVKDIGAGASPELIIHLGVFGHAYPSDLRGSIRVVPLDEFERHMRELSAQ